MHVSRLPEITTTEQLDVIIANGKGMISFPNTDAFKLRVRRSADRCGVPVRVITLSAEHAAVLFCGTAEQAEDALSVMEHAVAGLVKQLAHQLHAEQAREQRITELEGVVVELAQAVAAIADQGRRTIQNTSELADQITGFQQSFADYLASTNKGGI
ncbi:hypothetical protein [Erwinia sp. S59]|uniref:hypothetical protein n=1 Tax=Erwinia sp. S59 TaxID=2769340 RepID=UPI00190B6DCE|nr:hypothetical protein [Erwinia sp. S59]MBK0092809.1 hypothetical protein [Erwinia sp. S59]